MTSVAQRKIDKRLCERQAKSHEKGPTGIGTGARSLSERMQKLREAKAAQLKRFASPPRHRKTAGASSSDAQAFQNLQASEKVSTILTKKIRKFTPPRSRKSRALGDPNETTANARLTPGITTHVDERFSVGIDPAVIAKSRNEGSHKQWTPQRTKKKGDKYSMLDETGPVGVGPQFCAPSEKYDQHDTLLRSTAELNEKYTHIGHAEYDTINQSKSSEFFQISTSFSSTFSIRKMFVRESKKVSLSGETNKARQTGKYDGLAHYDELREITNSGLSGGSKPSVEEARKAPSLFENNSRESFDTIEQKNTAPSVSIIASSFSTLGTISEKRTYDSFPSAIKLAGSKNDTQSKREKKLGERVDQTKSELTEPTVTISTSFSTLGGLTNLSESASESPNKQSNGSLSRLNEMNGQAYHLVDHQVDHQVDQQGHTTIPPWVKKEDTKLQTIEKNKTDSSASKGNMLRTILSCVTPYNTWESESVHSKTVDGDHTLRTCTTTFDGDDTSKYYASTYDGDDTTVKDRTSTFDGDDTLNDLTLKTCTTTFDGDGTMKDFTESYSSEGSESSQGSYVSYFSDDESIHANQKQSIVDILSDMLAQVTPCSLSQASNSPVIIQKQPPRFRRTDTGR